MTLYNINYMKNYQVIQSKINLDKKWRLMNLNTENLHYIKMICL